MDNEIEENKSRILECISTILEKKLDNFDNCSQDFLPSWDSLNHAQIIFAIEDEFEIEFSQEQMANITSAQDILNIVSHET